MFARRCSRLVASKTAVPLTSYLSRVGRPYSSAAPAYENILTETPRPGVGLSKHIEPIEASLEMNMTAIELLT